ncbi:MAG TPA: DUF1232 domain-containing protein [Burkholderiaceae bacterium]|nr:DUF1232 domain-containing protein [Burkholderiaceae bacterium]
MWAVRAWTLLKTVGRDGLVLLHALRDAETPLPLKAAIVALAAYAVSPVDLLPDFALLFGWADDLALLMIGIPFLVKRLPAAVRARAERAAGRFGARRA